MQVKIRMIIFFVIIFLFSGCNDINNVFNAQTVILYPGEYRVYVLDKLKESSITYIDGENSKKIKIRNHMVFFADYIGKYELNNCIPKKYEPIKCDYDGMFVAGGDIECGEYDILLNDGEAVGEFTVYEDTGFHSFEDACLSETVTGSAHKSIILKTGQLISIYKVTLIKKEQN